MAEFFTLNFDYCLFFCGVSFILLASLAFTLGLKKGDILPWKYFGVFCLLYGITAWLDVIGLGFGDNTIFSLARIILRGIGFSHLLEFGRSGTASPGKRVPGKNIHFLFPVLALAGGIFGLEGLNATVRYFMGLPGGLWASWVLWHNRDFNARRKPALVIAAVSMALCGLAFGAVVPRALFPPSSILNEVSFASATGLPVQLIQGILALVLALAILRFDRVVQTNLSPALKRRRTMREVLIPSLFIIVLYAGWAFTTWAGVTYDQVHRQYMRNLLGTNAAALDARMVARLTGTAADLASPDYKQLKKQMAKMKNAAEGVRFCYLMRMAGDTAIFLVDSEPEGSPDYSPPGQVYDELTERSRASFVAEKPDLVYPETDRWGTWMSASMIIVTDEGRNVGLLGFDIAAAEWSRNIALVRSGSIISVMFLSGLLLLFYSKERRNREARETVESVAGEQSLLLNTINTQVWYLSDPETYGLVNDAHAAFLGRSAGDVSYHPLVEFCPEGEARQRIGNNREVFASRKRASMEAWATDGRGYKRLLNIVKTPKLDENGNIEYVVCSAEDITERMLTENALKMSEARFRSYFELPLIGIAITSTTKGWIDVNDCLCEMLGYSREELLCMTWSELTHPEDLAGDVTQFDRMLAGEIESYTMDKRFVRKGGAIVWTSLAVGCLRKPDGAVDYVLALVQDISDRKGAEEALQKSEERYRLLAENSTDVIWTMTLDGRFLYISPSVTQLAGFTPEEALEIPMERYIVAEYLPAVREKMRKELEKPPGERHRSSTLDVKQYTKDGSVIDVEVTTSWILNDKGEPIGIQGSTRDIRERKKAEADLRDREEILNAITGSAMDGIIMVDNDGAISFWNEAATRIFGYRTEEVMGRIMHENIMPKSHMNLLLSAFSEFQKTGGTHLLGKTLELNAYRKDRTEVPIELSPSSVMLKGKWCGVGVIRDITERKRAETEIAKTLEEKSVLLRELQHRVKNSLNMIVSLVDLESHRVKGFAIQNVLEQIRDRIMSLSNLYDLMYRSEEVREVRLDKYLGQVCRSIFESYLSDIERISLNMYLGEARIKVQSAIPLGLAVNEIMTNSLKYAFPNGRRGAVTVNLTAGPESLVIEVSDDGIGLPPDFNTEISKGMGNILIPMMVKQLKGTLEIEHGAGTLYRIRIPVSK